MKIKYLSSFTPVVFALIALFPVQSIAQKPAEVQIKQAAEHGGVWIPDNGDGTYRNPIIYADYSDPDIVRVGDDYYMTSSSFSDFPGLPVLHSKDLVNWRIIGHAVMNYPITDFDKPRHGNGIWAPSIRYHNGEFYIYYGDPDYGIFMTKSENPAGPWEPLTLVRKAKGWIDPCPLWDDDGNVYLVHAYARSRSGIKHRLDVNRLSSDGKSILDEGIQVFCDSVRHPTMEGPKFYKRNGYYYIFAPAGGVKPGWQVVLRSKNIYGPYEDKIVLEQGSTIVNGPHQGGWVETKKGESWFVHFQDRYAYGRIVHLQPMKWENDWPVMGEYSDGNGIGEPVSVHQKPDVGKKFPVEVPQTDDEFDSARPGLQWQWEANFKSGWISLEARKGWLRFFGRQHGQDYKNLWDAPYLYLQKLPAPQFTTTVAVEPGSGSENIKAGLIIFGADYSYISVEKSEGNIFLSQVICKDADRGKPEEVVDKKGVSVVKVYLRAEVKPADPEEMIPVVFCNFSYSLDGKNFIPFGSKFTAREGRWIGAKIGLFSVTPDEINAANYADFDFIRFTK